jgi:superfamily II DNA/RNA helicase
MDAFKTHDDIIGSYREYLKSFLSIADERIQEEVKRSFEGSGFLPEPLVQFNPAYEVGESLEGLNVHHHLPRTIGSYNLYRHQVNALRLGLGKKGFIVTSGTGSGKSLTYLATIFNRIFEAGSQKPKGIKAILVYPMNALINSQEEEIKAFESNFGTGFPITYAKYSGQEGSEERERIRQTEPDIILTNYMMLELIMTRASETWLRNSLRQHLQFLVFDELHTYKGRQGSDVSMLIRRIKNLANNPLICIGTSATMASQGTPDEKKLAVATVASKIFGEQYALEQIIDEYLVPCTRGIDVSPHELRRAALAEIDKTGSEDLFVQHPLTNWLEMEVALRRNVERLERGLPLSISEISKKLQRATEITIDQSHKTIVDILQWAERLNEENRLRRTRRTFLPFRFHQFISQTSTVAVTLESRNNRSITIKAGRYIREDQQDKLLYPVLFSRFSGVDFICVEKNVESQIFLPRNPEQDVNTMTQEELRGDALNEHNLRFGYLVLDEGEDFWNENLIEFAPDAWLNPAATTFRPYYQWHMPQLVYFNSEGKYSAAPIYPLRGYYIPVKLRIDPTAGVFYEDANTNERTKLMSLGHEGRSTATTILTYSIVKSLRDQQEPLRFQKLLSFSDNRQDSALQAGHFNDFIASVRLRSALHHALQNENDGLDINSIAERVLGQLRLSEDDYVNENMRSRDPEFPEADNERAIKTYILIRIFQDLKRGWRYTLPNLEQTALLRVVYDQNRLDRLAGMDNRFQGFLLLDVATPDTRKKIITQLLNYFRTNFSIYHRYFDEEFAETENLLRNRLDSNKLWALDYNEKLDRPTFMVSVRPGRPVQRGVYFATMGSRSGFGKFLQREFSRAGLQRLSMDDFRNYVEQLCELLVTTGFLTPRENLRGDRGTVTGYLLRSDVIRWLPGDGANVEIDHTRINTFTNLRINPNPYFRSLYQTNFHEFQRELVTREHTGQLSSDDRIKREQDFDLGKLACLYCSPTMELGVNIANLNVVHMRSVPPSPANYAQRSGRAGRSGQTAVVVTYCSAWSPHDQHYFKNAAQMVAGSVVPPRLDLLNDELLTTHFNAYILMQLERGDLRTSVAELLDITNENNIALRHNIRDAIEDSIRTQANRWISEFREVLGVIDTELRGLWWFSENWYQQKINNFLSSFENAFRRWIRLYQSARRMISNARVIMDDVTIRQDADETREARRRHNAGLKQIELLMNVQNRESGSESEFYVFRYLAAEGFLPGYNFTRLPVRTFVGFKHSNQGEYISRSRSIGLSEFGPHNILYHNGGKYEVNRMNILDAEELQRRIKISHSTGYAYLDDEAEFANHDPITRAELRGSNYEFKTNLLELSETEAVPRQRISCIEEEREKKGYQLEEYFRYPTGIEHTSEAVIQRDGVDLLRLIYGQATELIKINRRSKRAVQDREGFSINRTNGKWLTQRELENDSIRANSQDVVLFIRENADTLYIQPLDNLQLTPEQIINLSYALKRAIEIQFQVEGSEIGVKDIGNADAPNLMIYEAAQGSLGILSQLIDEPPKLRQLFRIAYSVLHFDPNTREETDYGKTLPRASYEDLLSYYNQRHHDILDRYSIEAVLQTLMDCEVSTVSEGRDYEGQYQHLLGTYDKGSATELQLLRYLYNNRLALPHRSQVRMDDYYICADFVYDNGHGSVIIFCDGSVHDQDEVRQRDEHQRRLLRDAGYDVIVWHYLTPLEQLIETRRDIFRTIG